MDFSSFAAMLTLDVDSILAVAAFLSVGIFATIQMLKVLQIVKDSAQTGKVSLLLSGIFALAMLVGYFIPAAMPVILLLYSVLIAVDSAALGYKYLAGPVLKKLFPGAEISTDELNA